MTVHVGTRLQASLVLSCPGVTFDGLSPASGTRSAVVPSGLRNELDSVRARVGPGAERQVANATRRRKRLADALSADGRWSDEATVRRELAPGQLLPSASQYHPQALPSVEDGLEFLPMYYDERTGPVALSDSLGGWEGRVIDEEGGSEPLGVAVPPTRPPELSDPARQLLEEYLRYWLSRDAFLAAVQLSMLDRGEPSVVEAARHDLWTIASDVMARAAVRAKFRGGAGRSLSRTDLVLGIRATDQDWLDRPTWGERF